MESKSNNINNNKNSTLASKKVSLYVTLDKENIPPTEENNYATAPSPKTKRRKIASADKTTTSKTAKIRKTNTNINKRKPVKILSQICNNDVIANKTNSKMKQEEIERGHNVVSPICKTNIDLISRRLKENMTKVTYKMMASLALSNQAQDHYLYDAIFKPVNCTKDNSINDKSSNMEILVCGASLSAAGNINNDTSDDDYTIDSSPPSFINQEYEFMMMEHSIVFEQESDFINTWFQQHDNTLFSQ